MLWTIVAVLLILWLLGFSLHVAGGLIHLLLVVVVMMVVFVATHSGICARPLAMLPRVAPFA